jgi:hypothetical protein
VEIKEETLGHIVIKIVITPKIMRSTENFSELNLLSIGYSF